MADWSHNVINNSEEYREFAHTLGYAILNCGVIEFVTYSYAATLTGGNVFGTGLAQSPFSERRIRIQDLLVQAEIDETLCNTARALWDEAGEVMRWRNVLAHNPIHIMAINRENGSVERDVVVIDMKKTKPQKIQHLEIGELAKIVNRAEYVVRDLSECLVEIKHQLPDQ